MNKKIVKFFSSTMVLSPIVALVSCTSPQSLQKPGLSVGQYPEHAPTFAQMSEQSQVVQISANLGFKYVVKSNWANTNFDPVINNEVTNQMAQEAATSLFNDHVFLQAIAKSDQLVTIEYINTDVTSDAKVMVAATNTILLPQNTLSTSAIKIIENFDIDDQGHFIKQKLITKADEIPIILYDVPEANLVSIAQSGNLFNDHQFIVQGLNLIPDAQINPGFIKSIVDQIALQTFPLLENKSLSYAFTFTNAIYNASLTNFLGLNVEGLPTLPERLIRQNSLVASNGIHDFSIPSLYLEPFANTFPDVRAYMEDKIAHLEFQQADADFVLSQNNVGQNYSLNLLAYQNDSVFDEQTNLPQYHNVLGYGYDNTGQWSSIDGPSVNRRGLSDIFIDQIAHKLLNDVYVTNQLKSYDLQLNLSAISQPEIEQKISLVKGALINNLDQIVDQSSGLIKDAIAWDQANYDENIENAKLALRVFMDNIVQSRLYTMYNLDHFDLGGGIKSPNYLVNILNNDLSNSQSQIALKTLFNYGLEAFLSINHHYVLIDSENNAQGNVPNITPNGQLLIEQNTTVEQLKNLLKQVSLVPSNKEGGS